MQKVKRKHQGRSGVDQSDLAPIVLEQNGSFLVTEPMNGESRELVLTESGLECDCFMAQVIPDPCRHVIAVQDFIDLNSKRQEIDQAEADLYLAHVASLDAEIEQHQVSANAQIARIEAWLGQVVSKLDRKRNFWLVPLEQWSRNQGKSTQSLVSGKLTLRQQPVKIEVLDEDKVKADLRFQRVIPERIDLDRRALRKLVTQTGEEPEGVKVKVVPPKFSYQLRREE